MAAAQDLWCQVGRSRGGQRPRGISSRRPRSTGLDAQRAEDLDHPGGVLHAFVRSFPLRSRSGAAPRPDLSPSTPRRGGVTVRGFGRLDGDEGSPRCSSTTCSCPMRPVLGGWRRVRVAMATTGSERGLTLRSPGRFTAAVDRLVELYDSTRATPCREPGIEWCRPGSTRRLPLFTLGTVTAIAKATRRAPSRVSTKSGGRRWTYACTSSLELLGGEAELDGPWMRGFEFPCRTHSTRGPMRCSATSPPSGSSIARK